MATAACGSIQLLQGVLLSLPRSSASLLRNAAATKSPCSPTMSRPLSSDARRNVGEGWVKNGRRMKRTLTAYSTTDDRVELDENPEGIISGEWPENFSLLSYDDLRAYLEPQILKDQMKPSAPLGDVMSTKIRAATANHTLEEIDHHFQFVSGLPVVDSELKCIGIVSKKDRAKAQHGELNYEIWDHLFIVDVENILKQPR